MIIEKDCAVFIHYKLTNTEGQVLDSSEGQEPMPYLHGADNIIPGLEKELEGKQKGDQITATIEPENAYGEIHPQLIQEVPREAFQGIETIEVGQRFNSEDQQGNPRTVVVEAVSDTTVTVNGNHPLAGQTLHFDVTIDDVRKATSDELEHGHVHTAGCNH